MVILHTPPPGGAEGTYDLVIRTQEEFDAMITSETWLDAKSVALMGDGGSSRYFSKISNNEIIVPNNVIHLDGFNYPILISCCLNGHSSANISNIIIEMGDIIPHDIIFNVFRSVTNCRFIYFNMSSSWSYTGFANCTNLYRCEAMMHGIEEEYLTGFDMCTNIDCCNVNIMGYPGKGMGFINCSNLSNIDVSIDLTDSYYEAPEGLTNCNNVNSFKIYINQKTNGGSARAIQKCTNVSNGSAETNKGYCFFDCIGVSNVATHTPNTNFYNCSYLNGCRRMDSTVTSTFLGGTNTHIDTATVETSTKEE